MNDERFIDIEHKLLHQEVLLEELHQVIYEQQKKIDQMDQELKTFLKRYKPVDNLEIGPGDQKPPHY